VGARGGIRRARPTRLEAATQGTVIEEAGPGRGAWSLKTAPTGGSDRRSWRAGRGARSGAPARTRSRPPATRGGRAGAEAARRTAARPRGRTEPARHGHGSESPQRSNRHNGQTAIMVRWTEQPHRQNSSTQPERPRGGSAQRGQGAPDLADEGRGRLRSCRHDARRAVHFARERLRVGHKRQRRRRIPPAARGCRGAGGAEQPRDCAGCGRQQRAGAAGAARGRGFQRAGTCGWLPLPHARSHARSASAARTKRMGGAHKVRADLHGGRREIGVDVEEALLCEIPLLDPAGRQHLRPAVARSIHRPPTPCLLLKEG
jgi:hypothetical protein